MSNTQVKGNVSRNQTEKTSTFKPTFSFTFNKQSIMPVIVQEEGTDQVLMLAYMNREALHKTIETGKAVFYSRSRNELWYKGKTSGNELEVSAMLCDCDQDTLLLRVRIVHTQQNNIAVCHTGRKSCFYRSIDMANTRQDGATTLTFIG